MLIDCLNTLAGLVFSVPINTILSKEPTNNCIQPLARQTDLELTYLALRMWLGAVLQY